MSPSISMSSPESSPSRLPVRQKGSLTIPDLPKLTLPPLPEITNPAIRNLALTHSSAHSGDRTRKRDLIYNQAEAVLDNEKLEHVGDGLLTAAVITLLHELYPAFGPGPATYLRSHMVSNRSLAQIAEQYGLPEMFIANASSKYMIQAAQKAKGSLFEAYVAGVYYSFLMPREEAESEGSGETIRPSGTSRDRSPGALSDGGKEEQEINSGESADNQGSRQVGEKGDKPVDGMTPIAPAPSDMKAKLEENTNDPTTPDVEGNAKAYPKDKGTGIDDLFSLGLKSKPRTPVTTSHSPSPTPSPTPRTHGQAFDHLCSWLWPLFTPVAQFLSSYLETESSLTLIDNCPTPNPNQVQNVPNEWKIEDTNATGAIGALNQYLGKTYGCGYLPTWITKKRVMDVWRMVCIVRTPEGKECRAEGKRLTKKAAMTVAAYKVWQEVKAWEEAQAEKRRAEEEDEDSEEGEEEVMMLNGRRPRGGRKDRAGAEGEDEVKEDGCERKSEIQKGDDEEKKGESMAEKTAEVKVGESVKAEADIKKAEK